MLAAVDQQNQQERYLQGHGGQHQGRQSIPPKVRRPDRGRPTLKKGDPQAAWRKYFRKIIYFLVVLSESESPGVGLRL